MTDSVRELDLIHDRAAIEAIDTGFETDVIFDVVRAPRAIELVERALGDVRTTRYEIGEVFAPWRRWERGWVAGDEAVSGFATVQFEPWHERLVLWFLYVDRAARGRGLGRALLARVEEHGREVGASHVWLETSNVNVPGVRTYEHLGYGLCGADALHYGSYMPGESAIYLAKPLG